MPNYCANIIREMRLINVDSLDIENFLGETEPYVILSRRWGPLEINFADWALVKDKLQDQVTKPQVDDPATGISKLAKACLQCRNRRLRFFWMEECCIDKRSTSEESESIDSMFSWYK